MNKLDVLLVGNVGSHHSKPCNEEVRLKSTVHVAHGAVAGFVANTHEHCSSDEAAAAVKGWANKVAFASTLQ